MKKRLYGKAGLEPTVQHFTNREAELALVQRLVDTSADGQLPLVMFYGVGGAGKSWLIRRLRETLQEEVRLPHAVLDLDGGFGGALYRQDPAAALGEIRRQLGVACPRFDLAYSMLRFKQGEGDEPLLRGGGAAATAWELVGECASAVLHDIPGSNLAAWLAERLGKSVWKAVRDTPLGAWLASRSGNDDFLHLRSLPIQELYPLLPRRLGMDLEEHLPARPDRACQGVVLIDSFEALHPDLGSSARQFQQEQWIQNLYEEVTNVLVILAGRDRLRWAEFDRDWENPSFLVQHLLGGLSEEDARSFLDKYGIDDSGLQSALLRVSAEGAPGTSYHPFSLGLCADTISSDRARGALPDPATFEMRPGDIDALAQRFLRSLVSPDQEVWILHLAQTVRFDEAAARAAYASEPGAAQDAAWQILKTYSFVSAGFEPGWWSLHVQMREALRRRAATDQEASVNGHRKWHAYWTSRSRHPCDTFAGLAWYHGYLLEPDSGLKTWVELAAQARHENRMADHLSLMGWWQPTGIETVPPRTLHQVVAISFLAYELTNATLGDKAAHCQRALSCLETLSFFSKEEAPFKWARVQQNLAVIYMKKPDGNRIENLERARGHLEGAIEAFGPDENPFFWSLMHANLAGIYVELPFQEEKAIAAAKTGLSVFKSLDLEARLSSEKAGFFMFSAKGIKANLLNNMGIAYLSAQGGERPDCLLRSIEALEAALEICSLTEDPNQWARINMNLSIAYHRLSSALPSRPCSRDLSNCQKALHHADEALKVYAPESYPESWAMTMVNKGAAFLEWQRHDDQARLQALACFDLVLEIVTEDKYPEVWAMAHRNRAAALAPADGAPEPSVVHDMLTSNRNALRVYTKTTSPEEWAEVHFNLGNEHLKYGEPGESHWFETSIRHFEQALEVLTRESNPFKWAGVQFNMGLAYKSLEPATESTRQSAVACFDAALGVYSEEATPKEWARAHSFRARTLMLLFNDARPNPSLHAGCIESSRAALRVFTREHDFESWAQTQLALGQALLLSPEPCSDSYAQAHACFEAALGVFKKDSLEWANSSFWLGKALLLGRAVDPASLVPAAIPHLRAALRRFRREEDAALWAMASYHLGAALVLLPRGSQPRMYEEAIQLLQDSLQVLDSGLNALEWLEAKLNLCLAYLEKTSGSAGDNVESALTHLQELLRLDGRSIPPGHHARIFQNAGIAYRRRVAGNKVENLKRSIELSERALQLFEAGNELEDATQIQLNLGGVYAELGHYEDASYLTVAIAKLEGALERLDRKNAPQAWALAQNNLGAAYQIRAARTNVQDLEKAAGCFRQALSVYDVEIWPHERARTMFNLGVVELLLGDESTGRACLEESWQLYGSVGDSGMAAQVEALLSRLE